MFDLHPLVILGLGMASILVLIIVFRLNAFIALITSAMVVSLLSPGELGTSISRVALAFGKTAGGIGIVIGLAVVIGNCMMHSGAADRVVRAFLSLFGQKRGGVAMMASGFVLSIPVFFDTVFYLLIPLARSMYKRTKQHYLKYAMAIAAGGVVTHSLVPPTPGPLIMADNLGVDIGVMIIVGILIALPASIVGMLFCRWADRKMNFPMRPIGDEAVETQTIEDSKLPKLLPSILPILLPVLLVSANTIVSAITKTTEQSPAMIRIGAVTSVLGNVNFSMLIAAAIAMLVLRHNCQYTRNQIAKLVEKSLMSGGVIILITAAGGAFGAMLKAAQIGPAIEKMFTGDGGQQATGLTLLALGVVIASVLKIAQGSSTVAMITASAMIAAVIPAGKSLGYHPVYLATAIGGGSMMGSWMNDSGFWIFAKMVGLKELETLKVWTPLQALVGLTAVVVSFILAILLPLT